jgi:nicotinate-nucleotide adenylyltransferase
VRIGIFGGSFDPVHRGHLALARRALERVPLDEIRLVPARLQPLKTAGPRASAGDRVGMIHAAIHGWPGWVLDSREIDRPGPSYTVDTVRALMRERPGDELFLLLGADAARDFPQWREAETLRVLATLVVAPRAPSSWTCPRWMCRRPPYERRSRWADQSIIWCRTR